MGRHTPNSRRKGLHPVTPVWRADKTARHNQNPNTLENALVNRVRSCWSNRQRATPEQRANLKDAIGELRTFRTNRERNSELHAKLDKEAITCYRGKGILLGATEAEWRKFCENRHILTRVQLDAPQQTGIFDTLLISELDEPKGRDRTRPPQERIDTRYFTETRTAIDKSELTPYLPVRQMCSFIMERTAQQEFLHKIRILADDQRDHPDHKRDFKRIYRLANRVLNEIHEQSRHIVLTTNSTYTRGLDNAKYSKTE